MFKYRLIFWDEIDDNSKTISGYISGVSNYTDAMDTLIHWYGDDCLLEIKLLERIIPDTPACLELKPSASFLEVENCFEEVCG